MTKNEFIQEAALRLLNVNDIKHTLLEDIAKIAKLFADEVWKQFDEEQTEEPKAETPLPQDVSVSVLAQEIARIEKEKVDAMNEEYRKNGYTARWQISGADIRFLNVCNYEGIKTIADIRACGRVSFRRKKNMGEKTMDLVDQAMNNLYGKLW